MFIKAKTQADACQGRVELQFACRWYSEPACTTARRDQKKIIECCMASFHLELLFNSFKPTRNGPETTEASSSMLSCMVQLGTFVVKRSEDLRAVLEGRVCDLSQGRCHAHPGWSQLTRSACNWVEGEEWIVSEMHSYPSRPVASCSPASLQDEFIFSCTHVCHQKPALDKQRYASSCRNVFCTAWYAFRPPV